MRFEELLHGASLFCFLDETHTQMYWQPATEALAAAQKM